MKTIMLAGRTGAGKTSFRQALCGQALNDEKTQMVQVLDGMIDTPGEYMENRALYRALIVTAAEAELIVLVQDCTDQQCVFAPGIAGMFGKPAVGLVTKIDLAENEQALRQAEEKLKLAGCERIFRISAVNGGGIAAVRDYLVHSEESVRGANGD